MDHETSKLHHNQYKYNKFDFNLIGRKGSGKGNIPYYKFKPDISMEKRH